jgi:hypothetical protein
VQHFKKQIRAIMKYLFLLLLSVFPVICSGQDFLNKQYSIRSGLLFDYSNTKYSLTPMMIGISKYNKKGNMHIIELQQLKLSKDISENSNGNQNIEMKEYLFQISLSYQYEHFINKVDKQFRPYIGYSVDLGFSRLAEDPTVSLSYPTTEIDFNPNLVFDLGFNFNLMNDFYIDFCIPIDLFKYNINSKYVDNPNIREDIRRTNSDNAKFFSFDRMRLKLELGLRF